ncbi:DUF7470 family protein [Halopelagius longus]|uniref:Major facilitator superfamily (MFS) profile domain-containing protein n=1 Tax=Halopelagius longus TaxID=1236180 RepID=A0A1H1EEM8_9EURY|nr:hypothetical protein [Halopelagius longus]RDI71722.1 hypothetical protein DWB78_08275 [Halopelagius longus]SDQ87094.1 hypothetical protein SAMN05216278_2866 [Halopelagius longus]
MLDKLGAKGIAGLVVMVAGFGLVAWSAPVVAAGLGLIVVGLVLVAGGIAQSVMGMLGMGGMP